MKRRREGARLTPAEGAAIAEAIENMLREACDIVDENGDAFLDEAVAEVVAKEGHAARELARIVVRAARRVPGVYVA